MNATHVPALLVPLLRTWVRQGPMDVTSANVQMNLWPALMHKQMM